MRGRGVWEASAAQFLAKAIHSGVSAQLFPCSVLKTALKFPLKLSPPRTVLESKSDHIQRKTHDVFVIQSYHSDLQVLPLCQLIKSSSVYPRLCCRDWKVIQCNITSYPSEASEGTARSLEHRELREVLVRIMIIHLLCTVVLVCIPNTILYGTLEFLVTVVQSFLRVTEAFYKCLQLGRVAKKGGR